MVILLFNMFNHPGQSKQETSYSEFIAAVSDGEVNQVTIQGNDIFGKYKDGTSFRTFVPNDPDLIRVDPDQLVPNALADCRMDLFYASNASRWRQSNVVWKKPGTTRL
jgi:ATP-dependent Zn protease